MVISLNTDEGEKIAMLAKKLDKSVLVSKRN
jgi:hypothetical protein